MEALDNKAFSVEWGLAPRGATMSPRRNFCHSGQRGKPRPCRGKKHHGPKNNKEEASHGPLSVNWIRGDKNGWERKKSSGEARDGEDSKDRTKLIVLGLFFFILNTEHRPGFLTVS